MKNSTKPAGKKPPWLKKRLPTGRTYENVRRLMHENCLHTVCQEAKCPNQWECFSKETATFLIMGPRCSRNCRFCAVDHGPMSPPDPEEPARVAEAVKALSLEYVVVTSVTRDDLTDGGAGHFAATIHSVRKSSPGVRIEVLIPDFIGSKKALDMVVAAGPDVINHNLETVRRLYPTVRPEAVYERSLALIAYAHKSAPPDMPLKSGLMLGLGETHAELIETFQDLLQHGCSLLTLGQYLQPSKSHLNVDRFVPPEEFEALREDALGIGFKDVASGPFVRSSYQAKELFIG
ncbi:MAG: lipoyl synthase [Thermodesulfobacteriota bacterium]